MNLDGTVRLADGDETLLLPRQAFRAFVAVVSYHDRLKDRIPVNTTEHFYGIVQTRSRDEPRARRVTPYRSIARSAARESPIARMFA